MQFTTMDAIRGLCVEKCKQAVTAAMLYNMYNDDGEMKIPDCDFHQKWTSVPLE